MLEYFTFKKVKKHQAEKKEREAEEAKKAGASGNSSHVASTTPAVVVNPEAKPAQSKTDASKPGTQASSVPAPVLTPDDEKFLERIVEHPDDVDDDLPAPPLPPRVKTPVVDWESDTENPIKTASLDDGAKGKGKGKEDKKGKRLSISLFGRKQPAAANASGQGKDGLKPTDSSVSKKEEKKEKSDITKVLDDLNLSAQNNTAFSLSAESTALMRQFTQLLKDLVNGVPTAYNDLITLIEDRDGFLSKHYEKLPGSIKKLIMQLPTKLTSTLAPELLLVASEAQGISAADASKGGLKGAAQRFLTPKNMKDLLAKPGAVVSLLRGIVNALKTRFPAFIGTNVLWSIAVFLLIFVLWYCHKRGREVRLEQEAAEKAGAGVPSGSRVEELPDDPQLPAPEAKPAARTPAQISGGKAKQTAHPAGKPAAEPVPVAAAASKNKK